MGIQFGETATNSFAGALPNHRIADNEELIIEDVFFFDNLGGRLHDFDHTLFIVYASRDANSNYAQTYRVISLLNFFNWPETDIFIIRIGEISAQLNPDLQTSNSMEVIDAYRQGVRAMTDEGLRYERAQRRLVPLNASCPTLLEIVELEAMYREIE